MTGTPERNPPVDIEAKERLSNIAKRLLETSYAHACDFTATDEEFQKSVDALVNHLAKVRRRARDLYAEKLTA